MKLDTALLKKLCSIHSPSGSEYVIKDFLLQYIEENRKNWKNQPDIIHGPEFQDCIILLFGKPRTAVFAHVDSIGYTVGYKNRLIKIGGPKAESDVVLVGSDSQGEIRAKLDVNMREGGISELTAEFDREIDRGTTLTYEMNFIDDEEYIQSCYLDNRLGVWNALQLAKNLEDGAIVFSTWEEHGGGSVGYLGRFLYKKYNILQALISDITWVTNGIKHGKGVAISMRDSGIPRRLYVNRIIELANQSGIPFQLEVESAGGSDGNALQRSSYPIDWCFIGAPEDNVHTPNEKVYKSDIIAMSEMYAYLMDKL